MQRPMRLGLERGPCECGEDAEVAVEGESLNAPKAERGESGFVLQPAKCAFDRAASSVEVAEPFSAAWDRWIASVGRSKSGANCSIC